MMQGKPSVLDPERQRKLEDLGFVWVVRNRPEWNNRYQELLQYREKYGDTKVPQHYKEISGLGKVSRVGCCMIA
jgi:Helicase associated domain